MSKKVFAFTIIILLVLSISSPAFADVTSFDVSVFYPEPYVDEYSGYFSYLTSADEVITYAWTFLPYHGSFISGSGEIGNASTYVEIDYLPSSQKFSFALFPGFYESSNFIMYRYITDLTDNSTDMQMVEYLTVNGSTNLSYPRYGVPVAYSFGGAVVFLDSEYTSVPAMNITFSEDSNNNYSVEVFYNYYKNMMDLLYPAIMAAFADINNIDTSVDNIENYTSQINTMTQSIINLLTIELVGSGSGTLESPYTIRDLLAQIANRTGSEYTDSDLDSIESSLTDINSRLTSILTDISDFDLDQIESALTDINTWLTTDYFDFLIDVLYDYYVCFDDFFAYFSINSSYDSFSDLLDSTLSVLYTDFYYAFIDDHFQLQESFYDSAEDQFVRQQSFYDSAEAFFKAYRASQAVDDRLDYNDSQDNSLSIFSVFNRVILQPFRSFWSQISAYFFFDSGVERSDSVITDYLFYSSHLPGFNNLNNVDWSTLP